MTDLEILSDYIRTETGYEGELAPELDLLEKQVLDSFSIVQWAMFIQERFGIELEAEELVRDNLSSFSKVMALIQSKRSASVGKAKLGPDSSCCLLKRYARFRAVLAAPDDAKSDILGEVTMPSSIPRFLCETAERLPDKVAIVCKTRSATFSQLHQEALATAECLRELGVEPGDRVGICMEKTLDQVSVILGVLFANAVVVPILPRLKQPNIQHIIENSGMNALVTDSDRMNEVTEFAGQ